MDKRIVHELVALADSLDTRGMTKEADTIDRLLRRANETLEQWSKRTGNRVIQREKAVGSYAYTVIEHSDKNRRDLWHLADYRVSSVSGLTVFLMPVQYFDKFSPVVSMD